MKIKQITFILGIVSMLALPAASFASTYEFVDYNGNIQSVVANGPNAAIATAVNLGVHSGVILVSSGSTGSTSNIANGNYQYIDANGNLQSLYAANATQALADAYNLGMHSGVIAVDSNTMIVQ